MRVPTSLETVLHLIPTYYMVEALTLSLAGEASLAQIGGYLAVLAGTVVLAFAAVVWRLRRFESSGA